MGADAMVVGALVEYIDYNDTPVPEDNLFTPFARKRLSYEHEREARLILWSDAAANEHLAEGARGAPGLPVAVDLRELISKVFVAPDSPPWVTAAIKDLVSVYGQTCEVVQSNLYKGPLA
jgi:hypothetical protein